MVNGVVQENNVGTPQGVPLIPLLSNIVLNELDKELEKCGYPFLRYADDRVIFCKTPRSAERVKESITNFIEKKLYLKVNREKTMAFSDHGINSFLLILCYSWRNIKAPYLCQIACQFQSQTQTVYIKK